MSILAILVVLLIIGLLLPQLGLAIDPTIHRVIVVALVIVLLLWLLSYMGVFTGRL